ncbi:uncharacterized protein J5F26_005758 [Ciconia maguari]
MLKWSCHRDALTQSPPESLNPPWALRCVLWLQRRGMRQPFNTRLNAYYPTTQYEPMRSSYDPSPASRPVSYLSLERKTEEQEQGCSGDVRCRNSDGTSMQPVGSGGGGGIIAKAAAEVANT